jgi:cellulose synthase/poly-beta-1,6-N-acetylglucosamine synthase-like glycosyltransferase
MTWDVIAAYFSELLDAVERQFLYRDPKDWFMFFFPIVVMFEIPRYYLPMWGLLGAYALGLIKKDRVREKVFLSRMPLVSVIVAGRNEEASIAGAIQSLLDQDYPNLEIIVIDDTTRRGGGGAGLRQPISVYGSPTVNFSCRWTPTAPSTAA